MLREGPECRYVRVRFSFGNCMAYRVSARAHGRDNNFNLIRMIAATGVLVSHAWPISMGPGTPEPLSQTFPGMTLGELCVIAFFAISGFFIAKSFENRHSVTAFGVARILRLFPALAVVLIVTILVSGAFLTTTSAGEFWRAAPTYFLRNLTLYFLDYDLPGVFAANPYGPAINGSLWTLNYEVTCYLGVALAGLFGLLSRQRLFGVALIGLMGAYWLSHLLQVSGRIATLLDLALPFAIGMALWVWRDRVVMSLPLAALLAALALAARETAVQHFMVSLAVSYCVFLAGFADLPRLRSYNRLGDYSYGMYIYAFPAQQLMAQLGATEPAANIAMALPVTLVCAWLSWHFIEEPALRQKGNVLRRIQKHRAHHAPE